MKNNLFITIGKILFSLFLIFGLLVLFSFVFQKLLPEAVVFATPLSFMLGTFILYNCSTISKPKATISTITSIKDFSKGAAIGIWIPCLSVLLLLLFDLDRVTINTIEYRECLKISFLLLMVAIGEEYYFRGYIYDLHKKYNSNWAIIINSLFFALIHLINPDSFSKPVQFIVIEIINIFLLGILFSITRFYIKRIAMAIGIHFTFNIMQSIGFGFTNGGKQVTSITTIFPATNSIWNGSDFGLESSAILTIATLLFIVAVKNHYSTDNKDRFIS